MEDGANDNDDNEEEDDDDDEWAEDNDDDGNDKKFIMNHTNSDGCQEGNSIGRWPNFSRILHNRRHSQLFH